VIFDNELLGGQRPNDLHGCRFLTGLRMLVRGIFLFIFDMNGESGNAGLAVQIDAADHFAGAVEVESGAFLRAMCDDPFAD